MTTKRWLLDLIEYRDRVVRLAYRVHLAGAPPEELYPDRTAHEAELHAIERARQLVEKGPDEP
jgi:hypothetical protein